MVNFNQNIAVVIGINNYKPGISTLKTAVDDATRIAQILKTKHEYNVHLLLDGQATKAGIEQCLNALSNQMGEKARLLFYFAGHGVAVNDEAQPAGFLIPQDGDSQNDDSYVSMQFVHDALIGLPCHHMLGILDCCFAGAFEWASQRDVVSAPERLYKERYLRYINDPAWQVITSSSYDQKAQDLLARRYTTGQREEDALPNGDARHSPFAQVLINVLENGEGDPYGYGIITATQLYTHLRHNVEDDDSAALHRRQTPKILTLSKHDKGEYVFNFPKKNDLPTAPQLYDWNNPYLGLKPYAEENSELFFGRTQLIEELTEKVQANALTNVWGISGAGKSSLVMAGLIPNLKKDVEDSPSPWHLLPIIQPGENPLNELPISDHEIELEAWVANEFNQETWEDPTAKFALVVDQLEEIFTLCNVAKEREEFLRLITAASQRYPERLRIITTLRSDFGGQLQELAKKIDASNLWGTQTRFVVQPMTQDELRQVIKAPAIERVLYFDPEALVEEMINEVVDMPGALPLLSFTLSELYLTYLKSPNDGRELKQSHYEKIGGINGALSRRADDLNPEKNMHKERLLKHIMLRMVSVEGGENTRRRVYKRELTYTKPEDNTLVSDLLDELVEARLIVTGGQSKNLVTDMPDESDSDADEGNERSKSVNPGDSDSDMRPAEPIADDSTVSPSRLPDSIDIPNNHGSLSPNVSGLSTVAMSTGATGVTVSTTSVNTSAMDPQALNDSIDTQTADRLNERMNGKESLNGSGAHHQADVDAPKPTESENEEAENERAEAEKAKPEGTTNEPDESTYYEPAHDYLINGWTTLKGWIDEVGQDDMLTFQRRLWRDADEWERTPEERVSQTWPDIARRVVQEQAGHFIPLALPQKEGLLWHDNARSDALIDLLGEKAHWLNKIEEKFAAESTRLRRANQVVRRRVGQALLIFLTVATVAAFVAFAQRSLALQRWWDERLTDSQISANLGETQLNEDPVASLHLSIEALPKEGDPRPYVRDAEKVLTDAIRVSLERQHLPLSNEPLLDSNVAIGEDRIVVGGTGLWQVDYKFSHIITATQGTTDTFKVHILDNQGVIRWDDNEVQLWRETELVAERRFGAATNVKCATPHPSNEQIAICEGASVWLWTPSQNALSLLTDLPRRVLDVRWSPDGDRLAVWDEGTSIAIWDFALGNPLNFAEPEESAPILDTAWNDESDLLVATTNGEFALIYDMRDRPQVSAIAIEKGISGVEHYTGDQFFIWTKGGLARLWSATQSESLLEYSSETAAIEDLYLFPEHDALLLSFNDHSAQFYASATITESVTLRGHEEKIQGADLQGGYIATSSADGSVRVWDLENGVEQVALRGHKSQIFQERADVHGVYWLDEQHLMSYGEDGSVRRWQIFDDRGDLLCLVYATSASHCLDANSTYRGHTGDIESIQWIDEETFVTTSRDNSARRWNTKTGASETLTHTFGTTVMWDPSGTYVLGFVEAAYLTEMNKKAGTIRHFDTGEVVAEILGPIVKAFWLNSGIVTVDTDHVIRLFDPMTGRVLRSFKWHDRQITAAAEHANGNIAIGDENGTIQIWSPSHFDAPIILEPELQLEDQQVVSDIAFSQDGQHLLVAGKRITLWDLASQAPLWSSPNSGFDNLKAAFSPDEELVGYKASNIVTVIHTESGEVIWRDSNSHDQAIRGLAWVTSSPWDHQEITRVSLSYWQNRFFPEEEKRYLLLTWSDDDTARLWEGNVGRGVRGATEGGYEIMRMTELGDVSAAAVSPNGEKIATATILYERGPEGIIHTWRTWHNDHDGLLNHARAMITRELSDEQKLELLGQSQ